MKVEASVEAPLVTRMFVQAGPRFGTSVRTSAAATAARVLERMRAGSFRARCGRRDRTGSILTRARGPCMADAGQVAPVLSSFQHGWPTSRSDLMSSPESSEPLDLERGLPVT